MNTNDMQHLDLSLPERRHLEMRLLGKWSIRKIADDMDRDHGALSREVKRNTAPGKRYRADVAQAMSEARAAKPRKGRKLDEDAALAKQVEAWLRAGWSPERIAGRLKAAPPEGLAGKSVSHESIYQWLRHGDGRFGGLYLCLWTKRKARWCRKGRKPQNPQIEGREPVSARNDDGEPGHLESDSMIWREWKGLLSAQVDIETLYCWLRPCPDRTSSSTLDALRRCMETPPPGFAVRDVAFDNGSEGARHLALREEYGVMTYFCAPHSPWQKPQIENLNRTIRHKYPRKHKVSELTEDEWRALETWLNELPRKSLGYLTPKEAVAKRMAAGATRT